MFARMAVEVEESVTAAYVQHVQRIGGLDEEDEEGLKKVHHATQAHLIPSDERLDYTLVGGLHPISLRAGLSQQSSLLDLS